MPTQVGHGERLFFFTRRRVLGYVFLDAIKDKIINIVHVRLTSPPLSIVLPPIGRKYLIQHITTYLRYLPN